MNFFFRHSMKAVWLYLSLISFSVLAAGNKDKASAEACAKAVSWIAKAESVSDRLKLLVSLLERHSNIVTANLSFKRSLIDTYAHLPGLLKLLGANAASLETSPPTIRKARYVATGEAQYNQDLIKKFLEARVADIESLELEDEGDLLTQILSFKKSSVASEGRGNFDEKAFSRKVRKLLQVAPFIFDSDGKPQFKRWKEDRENIIAQIRASTPQDLENRYGDLLKEHLEKQIDAIAEFRDPITRKEMKLGQVKILYESMKNQFLKFELRTALTPISKEGGTAEERTLSLESLPAWVALVRGCYGGDCSILSVPYYALVKGVRVHFLRKTHDLSEQPSGYAISVPVQVNGKTVPYILTINGVTLTQVDAEMAVRLIAEDYQSSEVVLPDFKAHPNLVNTAAARTGMTMEKRKAIKVVFPDGWSAVDAYMKDHYVSGYTNYYRGPDIEDAYLSTVPSKEPRLLEVSPAEKGEAPQYKEVKDLLTIPLIQRGILGVQALSDDQKLIKPEEIRSILNLTQNQIQAARPLTELSSTRTLTLSEYRLAEEELGLTLQNLLELETAARAATLSALYREEPRLFTEHKVRSSPKAINALIDAYGPAFPEEIRAILKSNDLSDGQTLKLLQGIKPALTEGDLEKSKNFQAQLEGTHLEAWARDAIPLAFIRMNTADTALGRKLASGLSARDNIFILSTLRQPPPRESLILKAFQEIARVMEAQKIDYDGARDQWLTSEKVSVKTKARFLGMSLNAKEFNLLFSLIPNAQKKEVEEAIDEFSSFRVFARQYQKAEPQAVERSSASARPSILQRLLGRVENPVRPPMVQPVGVVSLPENLKVESFEFVSAPIPPEGLKFMMGSPPTEEGRDTDETQREVTITKPFQFQATSVTQWQWEEIMGENPSNFKNGEESRNRPVEQVSWEKAQVFIQKLNQRDPKWEYRLLTEAERELMARAGTSTPYSYGNDSSELELHSYFSQNSGSKTHPVAEKRPNPWGAYDVHGNVWEWVSDWYSGTLLGGVDPIGPSNGSNRVIRGGSWRNVAQNLRSAQRYDVHPGYSFDFVGFRLARTPKVLP